MAHDYLKLTYKSCPGAFEAQIYEAMKDEWISAGEPNWDPGLQYRLIPVMPADPNGALGIIASMINRGVYLGQFPIKLPEGRTRFLGWGSGLDNKWLVHSGPWDGGEALPSFDLRDAESSIERPIKPGDGMFVKHAVLSLADPDAHEILALNEPFWMRKVRGLPGSLKAYRGGRNRYHVEINGEHVEIDGSDPNMPAEQRALWNVLSHIDENAA